MNKTLAVFLLTCVAFAIGASASSNPPGTVCSWVCKRVGQTEKCVFRCVK
jgi:hypothetical protein